MRVPILGLLACCLASCGKPGYGEVDAREPPPDAPPGVHRYVFSNLTVPQSSNEARQLAKSVRAGGTEEQVYPIYQRMWGWIRDAQDTGKRLMIPQDVQAKIDEARAQLDKLDAYFD